MITPRALLNENKQTITDDIMVSLLRRLLFEMLDHQGMDLYHDIDHQLAETFVVEYTNNKARILKDEPLGYVLGYEWFYGLKLKVNDAVLIPRSETEELAGYLSADIYDYFEGQAKVVDIGTGSGALACALKSDFESLDVVGTDISEDALVVAQENAKLNDLDIKFYQGDMAEPLIRAQAKFDVVVCNPPYIKRDELIEASVKDYEPHLALFGGVDGLNFYRKLLDQLPYILNEKAIVAFEIGYDQKDALIQEIRMRFEDVHIMSRQDINQKDRMIFMYFKIKPMHVS